MKRSMRSFDSFRPLRVILCATALTAVAAYSVVESNSLPTSSSVTSQAKKSGASMLPFDSTRASAVARPDIANSAPSAALDNIEDSKPLSPLAANIAATLTDNIAAATKVAPGGTINYTAVITNNGAASPVDDASSVTYGHTIDSNTTLVAGSVHASPLAFNDTYSWIGNTFLDTSARSLASVTANDLTINPSGGADTFNVTTQTNAATTLGGTVTLAANGHFTYTPPVARPNVVDGASVNDSFTYTLTNSADPTLVGSGTVTITLTGRVWYLQAGGVGDGRSNTPSGSPSAMSTAADKSTDILYNYFNAGTLNGAFTLDPGQQLIGQGVALVANAITLIPAGSTPTIQNTAGNAVTLGTPAGNNILAGFNIGNTSGIAISGPNVGTLNISGVSINTTGAGLDLTGVGIPTVSVVLGGLTSTGGTKNVNLVGLSGTITLAGGALSGASGNAFDVTGAGTANISYSGTISNTAAARLINVSGKTGGTLTFSGALSGTGSSTGINLATNTGATINFTGGLNLNAPTTGFAATGGGTISVTGATNDITTTTGIGVNINGDTIGGSGVTFRNVTVSGAAANGVILSSTSGNFQITGATNLGTAGGAGPTGVGINIANYPTGTISFGAIDIERRGNTGILIDNFDGSSGTFGATTIPNQNNSGGYGIRVQNGSAPLTFASATISNANLVTAQSDGNTDGIPDTDGDGDAIFLTNNTGGFTLNGGTLSNCGNDCIDLRNSPALVLSGVNISTPGLDVTGATGAGFGGHGISAINLAGTSTITGGTISSFNTGNRDGFYLLNNTSTALTLTVQGTTFQNSIGNRGFGIRGDAAANMTITVGGPTNNVATNCIFSNISAVALQSVAGGTAGSTATVNLTVQNSTFQNSPVNGKTNLIAGVVEAGKSTLLIQDNTFSNVFNTASTGEALININNDGTLAGNQLGLTLQRNNINNVGTALSNCGGGATPCLGPVNAILIFIDDAGNVPNTLIVDNNTLTSVQQGGIFLDMANTGAPASAVSAKIINNCIGRLRVAGACTGADARVGINTGLANGKGIAVERRRNNSPSGNVLISGNVVRNGNGENEGALQTAGIFARTKANSNMSVTVTNNNVDTNFIAAPEMRFDTNANEVGDIIAPVQCDDITGNTLPAGGIIDINEINGTHNVEQASAAAVNTANPAATTTADAGVSFGVACAVPPAVAEEFHEIAGPSGDPQEIPSSALTQAFLTEFQYFDSQLSRTDMVALPPHSGELRSSLQTASTTDRTSENDRRLETPLTNYLASGVAFMSNASGVLYSYAGELDSMITPSVTAQEKGAAPESGETVTIGPIATLPASKTITIKYTVTVNTTGLTARQATTQGTVTANAGAISVTTTDPGPPVVAGPTVTLLDTTLTWTGATDTNWNTGSNWTVPGPVVSSYAPGVSNPAVNDVVIPAVATQPTISATDIGIYSLSLANTMTLTITNPRILTIGGSSGGDLTLNGIISGGNLNFGTGTHNLNNAGGTGSLSPTNVATVMSGSTVTLTNNLQAGALAVNAGGSMTIANQTLSLNGTGAALVIPGGATFTTTGSTVAFNGAAAQQAAGIAYNNLQINNSIGLNVTGVTLTGNATVNGVLTLTSSDLNTGVFTLTQPNTTASLGVSDVVGTVTRTGGPFALATPLTFGNPNNIITFNVGTNRPATLTVVMAKVAPATYTAAVQRNYTISQTGTNDATSTVRLHYLDSELNGNTPEANLNLRRLRTSDSHWVAAPPPPGVPTRDTTANWVEATGVLAADLTTQWTFSTLAPTATNGVITGRITDDQGRGVEGAVVRLEGTQNRKFITDANGYYRFDNVETIGIYMVTPSRVNYSFSPATRSFSQVGQTTQAAFAASTTGQTENPLDTPEYFVRQHYVDFLGREPDESGFNFWSDQILECGTDQNCIERRRENVSAAYFLSIEFQATGGLVDGLYRAAYGNAPAYAAFMPDTHTVANGVIVGQDGWQAKLAANKEAFVEAVANRASFHAMYDGMEDSLFVDTLISHTGVSFTASERDALVSGLGTGQLTRAQALRSIAENPGFVSAKFKDAFVMMEYFGYLRRDPDADGYQFWLNKLNQFNGNFEQAEMVKAFIVSIEYRERFPK